MSATKGYSALRGPESLRLDVLNPNAEALLIRMRVWGYIIHKL